MNKLDVLNPRSSSYSFLFRWLPAQTLSQTKSLGQGPRKTCEHDFRIPLSGGARLQKRCRNSPSPLSIILTRKCGNFIAFPPQRKSRTWTRMLTFKEQKIMHREMSSPVLSLWSPIVPTSHQHNQLKWALEFWGGSRLGSVIIVLRDDGHALRWMTHAESHLRWNKSFIIF